MDKHIGNNVKVKNDIPNTSYDKEKQTGVEVAICSTFTDEPIGEYIKWWLEQFEIKCSVRFSPYNQVFQELLSTSSALPLVENGVNILLVRFEDWIKDKQDTDENKHEFLLNRMGELASILRSKKENRKYFVGLLPMSESVLSVKMEGYLRELYNKWIDILGEIEEIEVIDMRELDHLYDVENVHNPMTDRIAHMPYSDEYYAAMGTYIARKICSYKRQVFKVIVLDCDNTLWNGIYGEDGQEGILIDEGRRKIQELMYDCCKKGMLLAICSRNNETDIMNVLERNSEMVLKKEHFVSWRINWDHKYENIRQISKELNLGLESFIFIDDSPLECAEMIANCPQVLTLNLPLESESAVKYLSHVWALDCTDISEEDKNRTSMYLSEKARQQSRTQEMTLEEFIKSLELSVNIYRAEGLELSRAAQLTQRTNQFNLSTIRRTEEMIKALMDDPEVDCFLVDVTDKFGSYGIVGVLITEVKEGKLFMDTFLLSCRVLGRGVEDQVLVYLKKECIKKNIEVIEAYFYPTEKNEPFKEFLKRTKWQQTGEGNGYSAYTLDVKDIKQDIINASLEKQKESILSDTAAENLNTFDHVGVAVADIQAAMKYYGKLGYICGTPVLDPLQDVYLTMCSKEGHLPVELVAPASKKSPVNSYLEETDNVPYHICHRVKDFIAFTRHLKNEDVRFEVISPPKPAILFDYKKVMFILIKSIGLVELIEDETLVNTSESNSFESFKNVIRILTTDMDKAVGYFKATGHSHEQSSKDEKANISIITMKKTGGSTIDLMHSADNGKKPESNRESASCILHLCHELENAQAFAAVLEEKNIPNRMAQELEFGSLNGSDFLVQTEEMSFNIFYKCNGKKQHIVQKDWGIKTEKDDHQLHKNYLLPIKCYNGSKLLEALSGRDAAKGISLPESDTNERALGDKVLRLCREVFKNDNISISDNFYRIGVNSLKIIKLVSRILNEYNIEIPLNAIFKNPTIKGILEYIEDKNVG